MKKLKLFALLTAAVLTLSSCAQPGVEGGNGGAEEVAAPADPVETIKTTLTQYSKWVIGGGQGILVFTPEGGGSFKSQLGDLEMEWVINDDQTIKTQFQYGNTVYSATYNLVEVDGVFQLQNVKAPTDPNSTALPE